MTNEAGQQPPNFIHIYPDVLPRETCRAIIDRFEKDGRREPSSTEGGRNAAQRSGMLLDLGAIADWREVAEGVNRAVFSRIQHYAGQYPGLAAILKGERCVLTYPLLERIDPGQGFNWHIDASRHANMGRFLACLLYLADVEEGGQTQFAHQGVAVAPRAGSLLLFPPFWTYLHRGDTPVRGVKYNLTNFLLLLDPAGGGEHLGTLVGPQAARPQAGVSA